MEDLIKKLEKLIELSKALKIPVSPSVPKNSVIPISPGVPKNSAIPKNPVPKLPKISLPGTPTQGGGGKPTNLPGPSPMSHKDPKKIAQQIKNAEKLKQTMPMLKSEVEKLELSKNGQWSLKRMQELHPEEDEGGEGKLYPYRRQDLPDQNRHQKTWAKYKKIEEPETQYEVHGLNDKTKHWSDAGDGSIAHYGDHLSGYPTETAAQYHAANGPGENLRDPYPTVQIAKDPGSSFNSELHQGLSESNGHYADAREPKNLGYELGEATKQVIDGRDTYHAFHASPSGKYTHVGQYDIDPESGEVDLMNGSHHPDHEHIHPTMQSAIKDLVSHQKAQADHSKSFDEANPHMSDLLYSENPEKLTMHNKSFQHFLKTGKALPFTPEEHLDHIKQTNPDLGEKLDPSTKH